jgi:putrescine aminotransferase
MGLWQMAVTGFRDTFGAHMTESPSPTTVGSFLHPFAKPTRPSFVSVVRGEGARVWTSDGQELIDAMASLWYCNVGHGRAAIADAVSAQMRTLETYSCFEPFTNGPADELTALIADLSPIPGSRVFLCGSGSESVDTSIKLARLAQRLAGHPERTVVISRERGYHGTNLGGTSAQGIPPNREGWGPLVPEVVQVPTDDIEALSVLMSQRGGEIAAVLTEPVQGAGGVWPPADGYLAEVRALCDRHGALLIFDEVITGFGRLGTWFAAEHFGVTPDMITFAKAVTSGYQQIGGVVVGMAVREPLESDASYLLRHGYTYSGHASSCAAGLANLAILREEELLGRAEPMGARLAGGLRSLAADGAIDHVRGAGAVWAVGLRPDQDAMAVRDHMLANGVITRAIGTDTCTFCPPLVTTDAEIDRIVDAVAAATTSNPI